MKNIDAIFENGAFHPIGGESLSIQEGTHVRLTVESLPGDQEKPDVLSLAASVYAGLTSDEVSQIEQIALDRTHFFDASPSTSK